MAIDVSTTGDPRPGHTIDSKILHVVFILIKTDLFPVVSSLHLMYF